VQFRPAEGPDGLQISIQMGPDLARQLVRAFASLPQDLTSQMDEAGVALATRLEFLRLDRGARAAARELWDLVKARGRPELLGAAVRQRLGDPDLSAPQAIANAEASHQEANRARADANRAGVEAHRALADANRRCAGSPADTPSVIDDGRPTVLFVSPADVNAALAALKRLAAALRAGALIRAFDAGSLALAAEELLDHVGACRGAAGR
jgi:ParB family chromosome partitioning protein